VFLAAMIAALERLDRPVKLNLDGVHEVHSVAAVETVNMLLPHAPGTLRLVLATRCPPPLILPRLALEGRLRGDRPR
jgi:LuxR family maltose regulon positive regulatory protein